MGGGERSSLARPGVRRGCAGSWSLPAASPGHRPPLEVRSPLRYRTWWRLMCTGDYQQCVCVCVCVHVPIKM